MSRISAIIPAYNESTRIEAVLDVLTRYPRFNEVIVVDDGSEDDTAVQASKYPVRLLKHERNLGKGAAMDSGVREAEGDILFFADADIVGLTHPHIDEILKPVLAGDKEMCIGMHNRKIYTLRFLLSMIPLVGGERALTRTLWRKLPTYYKEKFRVESGLNFYATYFGRGLTYTILSGVSRIKKEQKYGFSKGFTQRMAMYADQIAAEAQLALHIIPSTIQSQHYEIISFGGSLLAFFLSSLIAIFFDNPFIKNIGKMLVIGNLAFALLKLWRIARLILREQMVSPPAKWYHRGQ